jgi:transposase, IS30 family
MARTLELIYSQDELDAIADSLNHRPRATHDFRSPIAVFTAMLVTASQPSTPVN